MIRKRDVRLPESMCLRVSFIAVLAAGVVVGPRAFADEPADTMNACGCRRDSSGACYCERKAKCGCPGECEPKGCEEKRAKQMEREVEIETKKAEEAGRQKRPADTEDDSASPPPPRPVASKPPAHPMSAPDRRTLTRLLGLYVSQHPEVREMTVDDLLAALAAQADRKSH